MSRGQSFSGRLDAATRAILPDERVLHLHLLRHGEVLDFTERVVRGQLDVDVSEAGRGQHARLAEWLARHVPRPDLVLSSDLRRCRALAQAVTAATGAPLALDPRLREQSMGAWEGRTWRELTEAEPARVTAWWDDYVRARAPGGESLAELDVRARRAWDEHLAGRSGRVVVVTHIGVIRCLLARALGRPLDEALRWAPAAASHTALSLAPAGAVLEALGERPWLEWGARGAALAPVPAAPRIALSGSAGTGKTTLGRRLAAHLGVPFLEEGMRRRLEQGLQLHRLDPEALRALVEELWEEQLALEEAATGGFVADRSAADYAAFWVHYGMIHDRERTEAWMASTLGRLPRYDRVVLLPWGVLPLQADGVRSTNRWTQFQYQATVEALLGRHVLPGRLFAVPESDDPAVRFRAVLANLGAGMPS